MSANPVAAWDLRALLAAESTFGTAVAPASTQALELIKCETGEIEHGRTRPKRDRSLGRGMQSGYVEGDVEAMKWVIEASMKSRSAVDADPRELVLYKAAGMKKTQNVGTNLVMSMSSTPIESADFASMTLQRFGGSGAAAQYSEILRGCICDKLTWSGGNTEVMVKASGQGIGKYWLGQLDSVTLANGAVTTVTFTAAESYKLALGYYIIESECVQVTAVNYASTTATIVRGALSTSAVAHTAVPMRPYYPSGVAFAGAPIAEPVATVVLGSISPLLCTEWSIDFDTGIALLPHETSSKYIRGAQSKRYNVVYNLKVMLTGDRVDLLGLSNQRTNMAVSVAQGTGVGGIVTFASANCEVIAPVVPDVENDVAIMDIKLRTRDSGTGSDMFTITYT